MSAISNYIHLYRENYLEYGTYRDQDNKSDYSSNIFASFREEIRERAQQFKIKADLQNLENKYNNERNQKVSLLKQLKDNNVAWTDFIELVLKTADLDKKYDAAQVSKYLTIDADPSNNTLKLEKILDTATSIKIPKISKNTAYSYIETLQNHLKICKNSIELIKDADLKKFLHKKREDLERQLNEIDKRVRKEGSVFAEITTLENNKKTKKFLESGHAFMADKNRPALSNPMNYMVNNEIIKITSMSNIGGVMSNILGSFEEVLGQLSAPLLNEVTNEAVEEFAKEIKQSLISTKQPMGTLTSSMNFTDVEIELSKGLNQNELKKDKYKYLVKTLDNGKLTIELDYSTKNKADFSISIEGQEVGVSSKAIDLSKEDFTNSSGKTIPAHITLQKGTNLLSYLLKAQEFSKTTKKIGTHFLNVYATEDTANNSLLRQAADNSLTIFLLYTALSGDILKTQGNTGLLYVYDTGKKMSSGISRVHFFSISSIIEDLLIGTGLTDIGVDIGIKALNNTVYIDPNLTSITSRLSDANIKMTEYDTVGQNISARLTKVIGEARTLTLAIGLLNTYIKNAIALT